MGTSSEGQILTDTTLVVGGKFNQKIEYIADAPDGAVHAAHFTERFGTTLTIPNTVVVDSLEIVGEVEDIFVELINKRTIFKNITFIIKVTG